MMVDIETEFLYDSWYVAGWSSDFEKSLTPITILNEAIVIFRTNVGLPVALEDACPHRRLPLSCGRLNDDQVECGYHGLTFDTPRIPKQLINVQITPILDSPGFAILNIL